MSNPRKHHSLPQSYLQAWAVGTPPVLFEWGFRGGRLKPKSYSPAGTGYEADLYTLETPQLALFPGLIDSSGNAAEISIETRFMRDVIDTPVASALAHLRSVGAVGLSYAQRNAFMWFVASLSPRTPAVVRELKERASAAVVGSLQRQGSEEYLLWKSEDPSRASLPDTPEEFYTQHLPHNNAWADLMLTCINNSRLLREMPFMRWAVVRCEQELITGDRLPTPFGDLDSDTLSYTLPLSPNLLFVCAKHGDSINRVLQLSREGQLAGINNRAVAWTSYERIYSSSLGVRTLIEECFKASKAPNVLERL